MKGLILILGMLLSTLGYSHDRPTFECATIDAQLNVYRTMSPTYNPKIKDAVIKSCQNYQVKSSHGIDFCRKHVVCLDNFSEVTPVFTCETPEGETFDGSTLNQAREIARSELLFPCFNSSNPLICFNENNKEVTCMKNDEDLYDE